MIKNNNQYKKDFKPKKTYKPKYIAKQQYQLSKRYNKIVSQACFELKKQQLELKSAVFLNKDNSFQQDLLSQIQSAIVAHQDNRMYTSLFLSLDVYHKTYVQVFMDKLFKIIIINAPSLIRLTLEGMFLSEQSFQMLKKCQSKFIQSITFRNVPIDQKASKIISTIQWTNLNEIIFFNVNLTNKKMQRIAKGKWPNLKTLDIRNNHLTYEYFKILRKSKWDMINFLTLEISCFNDYMLKQISKMSIQQIKELSFTHQYRLKVNLNILSKINPKWNCYQSTIRLHQCDNINGMKNISKFYNKMIV